MDNTQQLALVNQLVGTQITTELVTSPEFTEKYEYLVALTKYLEDMKKNVDDEIKSLIRDHYYETGENSISNGSFKYTYVPETTRESFDSKKFKAEQADLYKQYVRVSNVSDSIKTFKLKTVSEESIEG